MCFAFIITDYFKELECVPIILLLLKVSIPLTDYGT